jgi:hypothetical protein
MTRELTFLTAAALLLAGGVAGPAVAAPSLSGASLAGSSVAVAPAGDAAGADMSLAQARRVFLARVCPAFDAIDAFAQAQEDKVEWSVLQPMVRAMADAQLRVSRVLDTPPRPWPASIRSQIRDISALQGVQSGMSYVLAGAGSAQEFQALVDGLPATSPGLARISDDYWEALDVITRRLDLPDPDTCAGRD